LKIFCPAVQSEKADEAAWQECVARLRDYAERVLISLPNEVTGTPDELALETVLKIIEPSNRVAEIFRSMANPRLPEAYLQAMLRNMALTHLRRRLVEKRALEALARIRQAEQAAILPPEDLEQLHRELFRLSDDERELLRQRFWQELTIQEIASRAGISYSAAAVRIFRLVRKLRAVIEHSHS
jgi:RNA polymerase sigma factor (sigma-70 family)